MFVNPEEILTRETLEKPHRTVIRAGIEASQVNTLLKALKQKLKEEFCVCPLVRAYKFERLCVVGCLILRVSL